MLGGFSFFGLAVVVALVLVRGLGEMFDLGWDDGLGLGLAFGGMLAVAVVGLEGCLWVVLKESCKVRCGGAVL
jgi:hypothetical protein